MNGLREFTMARVGLGRAGNSIPLAATLDFQLAHAKARDAVYYPLDPRLIENSLVLESAAKDRHEYLRRPDLGRALSPASRKQLEPLRSEYDAVIIVADGLSALAVERQAPPLLGSLLPKLSDWRLAPLLVCMQARVAIGDEAGELLGAALAVVLIGERPGLTSPDSLGAYLTWSPRPGRSDAERNCISNIRPEGLHPCAASELLFLLMTEARSRQVSGVALKPGLPALY